MTVASSAARALFVACAVTAAVTAAPPAAATPPNVPHDFWPPAPPCPRVPPRAGAPRPHILLHLTDDQGWANVGYHNKEHVLTPTMDRLATQEGIRFERHYAFQWCAPSRAALMTGRESYHVLQGAHAPAVDALNLDNGSAPPPPSSSSSSSPPPPPSSPPPLPTAVTRGMTMLPRKLQSVGYVTHHIGKWHLGMAMDWQTPFGRGFNTSLGYLGGGEDHYTQGGMKGEWGCVGTDLYGTHGPALGGNGTYGGYLYNDAAVRIIEQHPDPETTPMFMYLATQTMHNPTQVPSYYSDMYPNPNSKGGNGTAGKYPYTTTYAISNGMVTVTDSILANVTLALKKRGMWNRTLVIHLSDNGGPVWKSMAWHANNYPLRGGKHTNWEGGVRVVAFASGGFLPASRHGLVLHGIMHNADWYPTLATLAGASPEDPPAPTVKAAAGAGAAAAVPGVDGFNMWPYIVGAVPTSPRSEVLLDSTPSGGIVSGDLKLVLGVQRFSFWQAPVYPNASGGANGPDGGFDCGKGCLFNVTADPSEYTDLAAARPADVARLTSLFEARKATAYTPPMTEQDPAACSAKVVELGGFLGPYYTFAAPALPAP